MFAESSGKCNLTGRRGLISPNKAKGQVTSAKVLESEPKTDDSDDESKRPTRGPAKKQFKFK